MPLANKPSPTMTVLTTVYLALAVWFVGMLVGSSISTAALALSTPADADPSEPAAAPSFIAFALGSQLAFAGGAAALVLLLGARPRREPLAVIADGLNLGAPALKLWVWPLLIGANLFLWVGVSVLFSWLFPDPGEHLKDLGESVKSVDTPLVAALTLVAVGVLPGVGEEFIFRGFILRRLRGVIPAALAIAIVSLLFAMSHVDPRQAALIFPLGLWWTIIAWRARSAWPAVAMHALNNSWTLFWAWGLVNSANELPAWALNAILALTLLCFLGAVVALCGPGIKPSTPEPA
ncbi:MAG: membrane protease YdiL (CAAX protease family) [Phycisphaerales bacterium]|jgi:membrane protease YdiL (CAAX protease family)